MNCTPLTGVRLSLGWLLVGIILSTLPGSGAQDDERDCHAIYPPNLNTEPDWIDACKKVDISEDFITSSPSSRPRRPSRSNGPNKFNGPSSEDLVEDRGYISFQDESNLEENLRLRRFASDFEFQSEDEIAARSTKSKNWHGQNGRPKRISPAQRLNRTNIIRQMQLSTMAPIDPVREERDALEVGPQGRQLINSGVKSSAMNAFLAIQSLKSLAGSLDRVLKAHTSKLKEYLLTFTISKILLIRHEPWMPRLIDVISSSSSEGTKQKAPAALSYYTEYLQYFAMALEQMDFESYKIVDECRSITPEKARGIRLIKKLTLKLICKAQTAIHFLQRLEKDLGGWSQRAAEELQREFPQLRFVIDDIYIHSPLKNDANPGSRLQVTRDLMPENRRRIDHHQKNWLRDVNILLEYQKAIEHIVPLANGMIRN